MTLILASNNAGKLDEMRTLLNGVSVISPTDIGLNLDVEESGQTFATNAELKAHAKALEMHVKALAGKKYWEADGEPSPEFVVLFVPGESFLADALRAEPGLLRRCNLRAFGRLKFSGAVERDAEVAPDRRPAILNVRRPGLRAGASTQ